MFTRFMDMHSGGGLKEKWSYIYIEAPEAEATVIFYNRFGHNPNRVTCTCCGEDYSINECETLEEATADHRNCAYVVPMRGLNGRYIEGDGEKGEPVPEGFQLYNRHNYGRKWTPLMEYLEENSRDVLVIYTEEIKPEERVGEVPRQGYVWQD